MTDGNKTFNRPNVNSDENVVDPKRQPLNDPNRPQGTQNPDGTPVDPNDPNRRVNPDDPNRGRHVTPEPDADPNDPSPDTESEDQESRYVDPNGEDGIDVDKAEKAREQNERVSER